MMKNHSPPLKNLEKEKNHDIEASYHSTNHSAAKDT